MKYTTFKALTIIIFSSCCVQCDDSCEKHYAFENHYTLTSAQDSFPIGDTLWISCNFSNKLESFNGEIVDFSDNSLLTDLLISRIDTSPYIQNYQDFEIIREAGELRFYSLPGVAGYELEHSQLMDTFHIRFGIIPSSFGLYQITLSSSYNISNDFDPELNTIENCDEYVDYFDIYLNNGMDTNYEFLQNAKDSVWRKVPKDDFDRNGGFCFYVVK